MVYSIYMFFSRWNLWFAYGWNGEVFVFVWCFGFGEEGIWYLVSRKIGRLTLSQKIEKSLTCDLANRKTFDFFFIKDNDFFMDSA